MSTGGSGDGRGATSELFNFLGWAFLPSLATRLLLKLYLSLLPRRSRSEQSLRLAYKYTHALVIVTYLLYTIYSSYLSLTRSPHNPYSLLGVPISVTQTQLKQQWRKLSLVYHPDKVNVGSGSLGGGSGKGQAGPGEEYFVLLQAAYEVLNDPVKKFGFDRFGEEAPWAWGGAANAGLKSMREVLSAGAMKAVGPWYVGWMGVCTVLAVLGRLEFAKYWRFFSLMALFTLETFILTRTYNLFNSLPPPFLAILPIQPLLPYQQIILARKAAVAFFIALGQLSPLLTSPTMVDGSSKPSTAAELAAQLRPHLDQLQVLVTIMTQQAAQTVESEFMPFQGEESGLERVERRLEDYFVESKVNTDENVRGAMREAMREMSMRARSRESNGVQGRGVRERASAEASVAI